jgi:hypothetical protein
VNTGEATVGDISGEIVWVAAGIGDGGATVGCGGGEAVAEAHAVNKITLIQRMIFLCMNISN